MGSISLSEEETVELIYSLMEAGCGLKVGPMKFPD